MKVEQLMNRPVVTCRPEDSLQEAAHQMWDHDYGCLPVVNDAGQLVGMITDRDISMGAFIRNEPLDHISVDSAMAHTVFSTRTLDDIEAAEDLMAKHQIRRLPVIDGTGEVVGLLSINDIMREAAHSRTRKSELQHAVHAMASICEPRSKSLLRTR